MAAWGMLLYIILMDWQVGLLAARSVHDLSVVAFRLVRSRQCTVLVQCLAWRHLILYLRVMCEAGVACQQVDSRVRHFGTVFAFSVTKRGSL